MKKKSYNEFNRYEKNDAETPKAVKALSVLNMILSAVSLVIAIVSLILIMIFSNQTALDSVMIIFTVLPFAILGLLTGAGSILFSLFIQRLRFAKIAFALSSIAIIILIISSILLFAIN